MSAITGCYHPDGQDADESVLTRMTAALVHRGPDARKIWVSGRVGLGHGMLRTTPESLHEPLPRTSDDGVCTITADARIDNRDELIAALCPDLPPGVIPDSALILASYRRWGESCTDHLLGDFAFAIWDADREHLFCARDHMGVKPFYYHCSENCFAFASEIKALFAVPGIPRKVNERALAFRLAGLDYEPGITSYLTIQRLPAAHSMTISPSGIRLRRYWTFDAAKEIRFETDAEYEQAFREIFTEAVRCRMRSAFPVGAELSGGLDSSSVVCVARHLMQKNGDSRPLHTFSFLFDAVPESDERTWIHQVLAGGGISPHYIYPEQFSPLYAMEQRIVQCEEPTFSLPSYAFWLLYREAKNAGVRVVLNGEFGDMVISHGTGVLCDLARSGKFFRLMKEIGLLSRHFRFRKRDLFRRHVLVPLVPSRLRRRSGQGDLAWIQHDFAHRTGLTGYDTRRRAAELSLKTSQERHRFDLAYPHLSLIIGACDRIDAAHSVEPRYPFLDRRVIEFCLALPPEQRIRNGYTRAIEREALAFCLPPEIRFRTSKAFADPYIIHGLQKYEKENLRNILSGDSVGIERYVSPDKIREMYDILFAGGDVSLFPLLRTVMLAFWLREERRVKDEKNSPSTGNAKR